MKRVREVAGLLAMVAVAALAVQLFAASPNPQSEQRFSGEVRYVVDGDSLYMRGVEKQIRLWGINAPERNQPGYKRATNTLRTLALNKRIHCYRQDTDKFGRTVARCETRAGEDISRLMLESGAAEEYCWFSKGYYGDC